MRCVPSFAEATRWPRPDTSLSRVPTGGFQPRNFQIVFRSFPGQRLRPRRIRTRSWRKPRRPSSEPKQLRHNLSLSDHERRIITCYGSPWLYWPLLLLPWLAYGPPETHHPRNIGPGKRARLETLPSRRPLSPLPAGYSPFPAPHTHSLNSSAPSPISSHVYIFQIGFSALIPAPWESKF